MKNICQKIVIIYNYLYFLHLLHQSDSKTITDFVKQKLDLFKETEKRWYFYIKSYLQHHMYKMYKPYFTNTGIQSCYWNNYQLVHCFISFNSSDALLMKLKSKVTKHLNFLQETGNFISNFNTIKVEHDVTKAAGKMLLTSFLQPSSHPIYRNHCKDGFIEKDDCGARAGPSQWVAVFSWIELAFSLDKFLSLNLTFDEMKFITGATNFAESFDFCVLGNLEISEKTRRGRKIFVKFCGCRFLSRFSVYPNFTKIGVIAHLFPSTLYSIVGEYTIQDWLLAVRMFGPIKEPNDICDLLFLWYSVKPSWTLFSYQIEIQKNKKLVLTSNIFLLKNQLLVVHNGPGYESPTVKHQGHKYFLKSFQAFTFGLQRTWKKWGFQFYGEDIQVVKQKYPGGVKLSLPNSLMCGELMCALEISSTATDQINLTVFNFSFVGKESEMCKYGGFTTAQYLNSKYQENVIFCETSGEMFRTRRSFFSSHSSLLALLYWFVPYSSVNITILVQNTTCKYLHICPCTLRTKCLPASNHKAECYSYIKDLSKAYGIRLENDETGLANRLKMFTFQFACVVVHITRAKSCRITKATGFEFKLHIWPDTKQQLSAWIYGELKQVLNDKSAWSTCMYRCGYKNKMHAFNLTQTHPESEIVNGEMAGEHLGKCKAKVSKRVFLQFFEPLNAKNWIEVQFTFCNISLNISEANEILRYKTWGQQVSTIQHPLQFCKIWAGKYFGQICSLSSSGEKYRQTRKRTEFSFVLLTATM